MITSKYKGGILYRPCNNTTLQLYTPRVYSVLSTVSPTYTTHLTRDDSRQALVADSHVRFLGVGEEKTRLVLTRHFKIQWSAPCFHSARH